MIVVSALQQVDLGRAMLDAGAATICPKHEPIAALMQAVRAIAAGESWTSPLVAHLLLTDPSATPGVVSTGVGVRGYASGMPPLRRGGATIHHPDTAAQYVKRIRRGMTNWGRHPQQVAALSGRVGRRLHRSGGRSADALTADGCTVARGGLRPGQAYLHPAAVFALPTVQPGGAEATLREGAIRWRPPRPR